MGVTWHLQAKQQSKMIKNPRAVALTCLLSFFFSRNTQIWGSRVWALENHKLVVVIIGFIHLFQRSSSELGA